MAEDNQQLQQQQPSVVNFYRGATVFITGASGFMGKVLIEKLLYSCPDIKEVMILMRPKRGKTPDVRIQEMIKLPLFQRIHDEKPAVLKKLTALQGDVTFDGLGLSNDDAQKLFDNVTVVFHLAATLKLEGTMKEAINMNTTGTARVLELGKRMKCLKALIHLSTAFCYCDKEILDERTYDCPYNPYDLMRAAEWMDEKMMNEITPRLMAPHPNTYTFSKRLAEVLVRDQYPNLPLAIARPSIVVPAYREPLPGWVDSLNGPIGVMVGGGKGVIRSMLCNGDYRAEVIPVDNAINGLITIGWQVGTAKEKATEVPVYNVTCSDRKKMTWGEVLEKGKQLAYEYPFEAGIWYPNGTITTSKVYHLINVIIFHWMPAYLIDFIMLCIGQPRFLCRIQARISTGLEVLQFFTTRNWIFKSHNFQTIDKALSDEERVIFRTETDTIDTTEFLKKTILGGRQYCLKEPLSTLPKARTQLKFLYALDVVAKMLFFGLLVWGVLSITGLMPSAGDIETVIVQQD